VAEAQGGRVTYARRSEGGSVFTLYLPGAEDVAEVLPTASESPIR
jgi:hypothetical protein